MKPSCTALWAYAAFAILSNGEKFAAEDRMCQLSGQCHKNKQALLQFSKTVSTGQTNGLVQTGLEHTDGLLHANELVHTNGLVQANGLVQTTGPLHNNGPVNSIGLVHTKGELHTNRSEQTHYKVHTEGCQRSKKSPVDANFAALSEEGYASVAALCCHEDMRVYITRVAAAEGFQVCNDGGLSGILWWYDCSTDQNNYAKLLQSVKDANTGSCPWVGAPDQCPTMPSDCYLDNPAPLPDCEQNPAGITTTIATSRKQPECSANNAISLDFTKATIVQNNLEGLPSRGKAGLRMANLGKVGTPAKDVDLVITVVSGTYAGSGGNIKGEIGAIGLQSGLKIVFKFAFVETGTDIPVEVNELLFSLFDLDCPSLVDGKPPRYEQVQAWGIDDYVLDENSIVDASSNADGSMTFENKNGPAANPPNPPGFIVMDLPKAQREVSVMLKYTKVSSFQLAFGILPLLQSPGSARSGFGFAGTSSLVDQCQPEP